MAVSKWPTRLGTKRGTPQACCSHSSQTSLGRVAVNAHARPLTVVSADSTCPTPTSLRTYHEAVVATSHLTSPPLITKPRTEINLGPLSTPHRAPPRTEYIQYGPCLTRRRRSSAPYAIFFSRSRRYLIPYFLCSAVGRFRCGAYAAAAAVPPTGLCGGVSEESGEGRKIGK